jgi:hypothetical protein
MLWLPIRLFKHNVRSSECVFWIDRTSAMRPAHAAFAQGSIGLSYSQPVLVTVCNSKHVRSVAWRALSFAGLRPGGWYGSVLSRNLSGAAPNQLGDGVKRGNAQTSMSGSDEGPSPALRAIAAFLAVGLVVTSFGPLLGALRSGSSEGGEALVDAKLHKVPVFTVTDTTGRPFLVESEDHMSRRGYFFVDPKDAEAYLQRVRDDTVDAKLLPVGLDEALKYILRSKRGLKDVPEQFTLFPSERELNIAKDVTDDNFVSVFGENAVPLFYVDGLALAGSGERAAAVYPVFFEKETLDRTLATLREKDASATSNLGDIQVIDLLQTVKELKSGNNPRLSSVVFLPLEDALKTLRETVTPSESQ